MFITHLASFYDRVQLCAPPTSATNNSKLTTYYREGFVLTLSLEDGSVGFGEVSSSWLLPQFICTLD